MNCEKNYSISGIRLYQKLIETEAFKGLGAKLIMKVHPLCKHVKYDSDDYWRCVIRSDTLTIYHPTSTCRMGPDDGTTVVDAQLRCANISPPNKTYQD